MYLFATIACKSQTFTIFDGVIIGLYPVCSVLLTRTIVCLLEFILVSLLYFARFKASVKMTKKVAIIGAGTAGLIAIKCCLDEGLEPVCYEKTKDIGGLWNFREVWTESEAFQTSTVFRSTVTNTSKEITAFSDFPVPKEFPNYLHNSYYNAYLNMFTEKFDLRKHIIFNTNVKNVSPAPDYVATGRWTVDLANIEDHQWSETFDAVLVCNGHHDKPHRPDFPGLEEFAGDVIHTREYKRPSGYDDKRILVIGMGNSACDASAELARVASKVKHYHKSLSFTTFFFLFHES